jgi:ribosome-binding factor A
MSSHRLLRVRELLKREVGEAIRRELPIDQTGLITVNDVEVAGDLRQATVFFSILGNDDQQKNGLHSLQQHRLRIQDHVAKTVILKYVPRLRFIVDDSVARGNRVLSIIEELERTLPET